MRENSSDNLALLTPVIPQFRLCLGQNSDQIFTPVDVLHRRVRNLILHTLFLKHIRVPDTHLKGHKVSHREDGPLEDVGAAVAKGTLIDAQKKD